MQELCAGTLDLLRNSRRDTKKGDKMKPKWLGPYVVVSPVGNGTYRLKNPSTHKVLKTAVHSVRLKPYLTRDHPRQPPTMDLQDAANKTSSSVDQPARPSVADSTVNLPSDSEINTKVY